MKDERLKEIENKSISKEAVDFIEEEQIGYEDKRWIEKSNYITIVR